MLERFSHLTTILHSPTTARESTIGFSPLSFKYQILECHLIGGLVIMSMRVFIHNTSSKKRVILHFVLKVWYLNYRTFSDSGKRKSTIIGLYLLPWSFTWLGKHPDQKMINWSACLSSSKSPWQPQHSSLPAQQQCLSHICQLESWFSWRNKIRSQQ